jgi:hypothetical protein
LISLNLFGNSIKDQGGMALSNMLLKNNSLIWLDLNKYYSQQTYNTDHYPNYFSDDVASSFLTNMNNNFTLEVLSICYTNEDFFGFSHFRNTPPGIRGKERLDRLGSNLERNKKNRESVFLAVEKGSLEEIKLLLNSGAPFKYPREDGMTPLHLACQKGNDAIAKFLVQRGAKLFSKNGKNQTPIDLAKNSGHIVLALDLLILSSSNAAFISAPNSNAVSKSSEFTKAIATYREAKTQKLQKNYAIALTLFGICKDNFKLSPEYNNSKIDKTFIDSKLVKIKKHSMDCSSKIQF